jgi:pilus assembly protein CpaD
MSRTSTFAALAVLGLAAAACAPTGQPLSAVNNPSLYSVHQPVVERSDFVLDLSTSGDRVPQSEIERLHAWFDSIGLSYGDRIFVDQPQDYASAGAREDVARAVGEYGLLISDGAPVHSGNVQPGTIRVITSRATASVPGCPAWGNAASEPTTLTSSNYGCAMNANVAAMIANPEDLVLGQDGSTSGSATTATRAIRVYRERPPTGRQGLPATSTTGQNQ